jgi:hypothetical protein
MRSFMICNRQLISGIIKSSETAVHVARMGEKGNHTACRWKNVNKTDYLEEVGVDGRIY